MANDRRTSIRASQLRNFTLTGYDIKNGTISGSQKLIDGSVTESKLNIRNDPVDGYYLKYTTASGMEWAETGSISDHGNILTSNNTYSGDIMTVTIDDASSAFGKPLYCASDFHYERADATSSGTMPCRMLSLESGSGSKKVLLKGQICNTSWNWSAGDIYVSTTTGELTQTQPSSSGEIVQVIGYALSADTIFFNPSTEIIELL